MSKKSYSQTGTQYRFDVVVIGSGIAGLNYCLSLLQHTPQCKIALITKKDLTESNTYYAQGGIAAVTSADDSIEHHLKDTLMAGEHLARTSGDSRPTGRARSADNTRGRECFARQPLGLARESGREARQHGRTAVCRRARSGTEAWARGQRDGAASRALPAALAGTEGERGAEVFAWRLCSHA